MKDALGNPIEIGMTYGYSRIANGHVMVAIGTATKANEESKKVTLTNITEKSGIYGELDSFKVIDRARSVYGVTVFPIAWKS